MSDSEPSDVEEIRADERETLRESAGETAAPAEPIHVESADQFRTMRDEQPLLLVDFHAEWCGPCEMLEPIVEEVAAESDAAVAKVDVDELQGLAQEFGVRSVPTLLVFAGGEQVEQLVGVQEKGTLLDVLERAA